ncbi:MAG: amidohydrolase family protein [Maricaulis sp.]|uniref:metal-dependent hydrolase family protein n=1 Tax=Maricaulis sp. TaxID=1486257 RepID=UPI001B15E35C|nr:amidohydrolase family protein [Maricaulis sp.]MBO6847725.1 amidohydrolase family protein [Maricaulis sp.]MBO6877420.1 amidohydrolase family protein [Maricaulis sp.]
MIKTILAAGIAAIGLSAAYAQNEAPLTVIHAGQLLAVPGEEPASQQSILVRNGRIESVQAGYITPDGAEIIDLSDQFVLPGLIDSHVHLQGELSPSGRLDTVTLSSADNALDAARHARTTLMAGFTSAQEVGGQLEASIALRNAIRDGDVIGPRLRVSGPAVTPTGGHGDINGYSTEVMDLLSSRAACNGPADCRRAVRELVRAGVDVIKITATGGVLSNTAAGVEQQFFDDELEAIVEAARMMGRRVTAHAHGESGIDSFLEAGGASIEHGTYLDRDSIRLFRRNGAYLVPTVLAGVTVSEIAETADWMTPPIRAKSRMVGPQMLAMARRAHEGGVMIAFGTDSGVSRHGLNAREFQLLVEAGMTEMEAIVTATVNAADHIEMADDIGTIEAGKFADIIAVDGNPLEDISELMDVDFVMQGGRVHKNQ